MPHDTILIVEDDDDDVMLIRRAFKQSKIMNNLRFIADGQTAIDYLAGHGEHADRKAFPLPILILLDLKLPRKSGLEVLAWMKEQSLLKRIPVVILTSSKENKDVNRAYDFGVNSYLLKPVDFSQLSEIVKHVHLYWILTNTNPDISEPASRQSG